MKPSLRYLTAAAAVGLLAAILSLIPARPAVAQFAQPTHQAILDAISALRSALESALGDIQSSLDVLAPESQSNVRLTPPVFGVSPIFSCLVVNVSDATRQIDTELLRGDGTVVNSSSLDLAPGEVRTAAQGNPPGGLGFCRFTVENGTKADIRASLIVTEASGRSVVAAE